MSRKVWNIIPYDKHLASALAGNCGVDDFAVLLMLSRGIDTEEKIRNFVSAADNELSSPFLVKDMEKAAGRIKRAIENYEKIYIFGDYDADGVTSTALLYSYLEAQGADIHYHIPSRLTEGYGLSTGAAQKIIDDGADLVITVDNGIASFEEAELFRDSGVDFIVTDHHKVGEKLPDAYAVINPHRADDTSPDENLAGVGVAMKVAAALEDGDYDAIISEFGDLVAIGTIADIVPLTNENRIIAAKGLEVLAHTFRPGLTELMKSISMGTTVTSSNVAFGIAPRINAAGRMGNADMALELLITDDEDRAEELTKQINEANVLRQSVESDITQEIEEYFDQNPEFRKDRVLVAAGRNWHTGVMGIAASRLVEKYGRPAIVISTDENGVSRGSGRSIEGLSLYEALCYCSDTLIQFGGHTLAAGFSVREENIDLFRRKINEYASTLKPFYPSINIDCRLNPAHISPEILDSLALLEPFGAENPVPTFGLFGMTVVSVKPTGGNRHLRITFSKNGVSVPTVYFGHSAEDFPYIPGDFVDVAVRTERNEFMGRTNVSIQIKDIRPAGTDDSLLFRALDIYSEFISGKNISDEEKALICPDRNLMSDVFRFIRLNHSWRFSPEILCMRLKRDASCAGQVSSALAALTQEGILTEENGEYKLTAFRGKVNLSECSILKALGYKEN